MNMTSLAGACDDDDEAVGPGLQLETRRHSFKTRFDVRGLQYAIAMHYSL